MDHQRPGIAQIRDVAEYFQAVHELDACVVTALHRECEQGACPLRANLLYPGVIRRRRQPGIGDLFDPIIVRKPGSKFLRVGDVLLHPQGKRFDSKERVVRALGIHRHPQIAETDCDSVERECQRSESLVELQSVVGGFRLGHGRKLVRSRPVECAGINNCAAGNRSVPCQEFRQGVDDQCRSMLNGAAEIRRSRGVVDNQRNAVLLRDRGKRIKVRYIPARIGDGLAEQGAGVFVERRLHRVQIFRVNELCGPSEPIDRAAELGDRPAVQPVGGNDVAPGLHDRKERHDLSAVAGRAANRACTAFKGGEPLLQNCDSRVCKSRIDVADFLEVEQSRGVIGIPENVGRRLVDWRLPRARGGVGAGTRVDLQSIETVGRCI